MSPSKHALEPSGAAWRVELWRALALLLALKGAFLLVDPNLRLFMGDSASYLHAALSDWDPPDRSFVYPMLVEWSAVATQSALSLVLLQTLFGVIGALLAYWMLRRAAGVDARIALFAVAVIAVEPAQLFYERMLMAEAAGLLSLLALVAASVAYVQRGRLRWALVMAVCGVLAVAFRMSLLPVVFGLALLVPMLRSWHAAAEQDRGRRVLAALRAGAHAAVILACVLGAHRLYQGLYGLRFDTELCSAWACRPSCCKRSVPPCKTTECAKRRCGSRMACGRSSKRSWTIGTPSRPRARSRCGRCRPSRRPCCAWAFPL